MKETRNFDLCPELNCFLTQNRSKINESDAVVFEWMYMYADTVLPYRKEGQIWSFFSEESPAMDEKMRGGNVEDLYRHFDNVFNLSISYRKDSNIYLPYRQIVSRKEITSEKELSILDEKVQKKTRMAAWFVSNWEFVTTKRQEIVAELISYGIEVDVYGLNMSYCPRSKDDACLEMLDEKYKFYLSFENSNCRDYVTEKFFKILRLDVIPVALGGGDYQILAPKDSYLDYSMYESTKHLADHMKLLMLDQNLYKEYLIRKGRIVSLNYIKRSYLACGICRILSQKAPFGPTYYSNLKDWWYNDKTCMLNDNQFNRTKIDEFYQYDILSKSAS